MIAELGHFALALAVPVSLLQAILLLRTPDAPAAFAIGRRAAFVQFLLIGLAFLALAALFVTSDFSLRVVVENSYSSKPLLYKIAGVWGNHEGSMLLWVLMLAGYGALVARPAMPADQGLRARALAIQALMGAAFISFVLLTSNPFARLSPVPVEGLGLNPVLQDPALAIHPPMLYLGYVGFSVCFGYAVAALWQNRVDAVWARAVRPWALFSWTALTLGIALGSYWAYYELGWGGFWFWDPVENASLLPWLAGAALIHSLMAVERRESLKAWTVLLAIICFAMSLLGTFLVRSGVLTSVHAFASDPARGLFVLAIFGLAVGGALSLFAWRAPALSDGGAFELVSREGALVLNNLVLATLTAAVLLGTLFPLLLEALTGDLVSVGPPYFNLVCGLLIIPLVIALPFGPFLSWKRARLMPILLRLWWAALVALLIFFAVAVLRTGGSVQAALLMAAGVWIALGALSDLAGRIGLLKLPLAVALARLPQLSLRAYGSALAHFGLGVALYAVAAASAYRVEAALNMPVGGELRIGTAALTLERIENGVGPNYNFQRAHFSFTDGGKTGQIASERRKFWSPPTETTEVGLLRRGVSQVYVVLGERRMAAAEGAPSQELWTVRAYLHPQILLVWLGAVLMAAGGAFSLVAGLRLGVRLPLAGRTGRKPLPAE